MQNKHYFRLIANSRIKSKNLNDKLLNLIYNTAFYFQIPKKKKKKQKQQKTKIKFLKILEIKGDQRKE